MSVRLIDITGYTFGRLQVMSLDETRTNHRQARWVCCCDCGTILTVKGTSLRSGHSKSCGCLQKEAVSKAHTTHGACQSYKRSVEYITWQNMISRCENKNTRIYKYYYDIKVCARWRNSFENFYNDMGPRPKNKSLDRINPWGNYSPKNCRWADAFQQQRNKRSPRRAFVRRSKKYQAVPLTDIGAA